MKKIRLKACNYKQKYLTEMVNWVQTFQGRKVKDSRNRPGVAQRVPGGLGSQISMTFGT